MKRLAGVFLAVVGWLSLSALNPAYGVTDAWVNNYQSNQHAYSAVFMADGTLLTYGSALDSSSGDYQLYLTRWGNEGLIETRTFGLAERSEYGLAIKAISINGVEYYLGMLQDFSVANNWFGFILFDSNLNPVWDEEIKTFVFSDVYRLTLSSFSVTADSEVLVAGSSYYGALVHKFAVGLGGFSEIWSSPYYGNGLGHDQAMAVIQHSNGDIYAVGSIIPSYDEFLAVFRLDSQGRSYEGWPKEYISGTAESLTDVIEAENGNLVAVGYAGYFGSSDPTRLALLEISTEGSVVNVSDSGMCQ